ncbi:MAG TPA: DUF839 domain-containing protein [Candidatus Poseidoniales archaeon]|nr:MAG: hypothetical protein CXT65_06215 [Euryarchaeota archaeon]HIG38871.1 DUF839 domain-containing protein [Candidatus Poseidoniales archaeon]HIL43646.1 DUF839 domain-containing protein [Candidatus Poseidoniales archaeon]
MSGRSRRGATALSLVILVVMSLSPILIDGLNETTLFRSASSRSANCSGVCINEMMTNADGSDQGVFPAGEWVELHNSGSIEISLENWILEDIGGWVHPIDAETWVDFDQLATPYVLTAGSYAIIAENEVGTLRLNNAGETLYLKDAGGTVVHTVTSGEASNGVSKIPDSSDATADWIDSEENTPGAENSETTGSGGEGGGEPPSSLTRIMTMPLDAEVTGMYVDANGNLFVNAMHPDDNYIDATIGVVKSIDWNNLPSSIPELALPADLAERTSIRLSYGQYQHLLQNGDALSEGGVAGGIYAADDGELLFVSDRPDFNAFVPTNSQGTKGYLYTTWENRPAGISQILIEWNGATSRWDVLGGMMRDLSSVNGGWVLCFGSMSPWGTPLASEELYFSDTKNWNNPSYQYHSDQEELEDYLGHYPNPYDYGYIIEISSAASPNPNLVKHMAMGRYSHENAQVMPDERTVYLSDDGYDTVLFKFIANTVGDLSAGTLYAAKVTQDSGSNSATTGFDVEWVEMASSSNAVIGAWVDEYDGITTADYVSGGNSYITEDDINDWAEGRLNEDLDGDGSIESAHDDRVAFLESRKAAAAIGASDEWNKMEGVVFNPDAPGYLYLAMSDVRYDMSDGQGDIDVSENRCGIVYRMPVEPGWGVSRIEPAIVGGTYSSAASTDQCDANRIAGPDNLAVLNDGRVLIGEDTGKHQNNMVWLWEPPVEPVEWDGEYSLKFTRIMPAEVPDRDNDWLEITNMGDTAVSLAGWTIERIRSTEPWISMVNELTIAAGASVVLTENPANLLADGGIAALDGNVILNNMPWLVDSGSALQLRAPDGTVVDAIAFGGGIADIDGWQGGAVSVPGDGSPGLILMRGSGCGDYPDTDSGADWEQRWIRIGASTFCDGGHFTTEADSTVSASIGPDSAFNDLIQWIGDAEESIHLHVYQFMSPDLTHALLDAIDRGVGVTLLLEEGILSSSSTVNSQRGHAQALHDAGGNVLWMEDPTLISSPYTYIHSKVAVRDAESVWISSGNWKDSSIPPDGVGNREWSVILNSETAAQLVLSRMAWDENPQHLHISPHSFRHSPTFDWTLDEPSHDGITNPTPTHQGPFGAQLMTCPDDCIDGIVGMLGSAETSIELSVQYLDLDWYWGFGDNPIIAALHDAALRGVNIRLMLNGYYAEWDEEIRDTIHMFNTDWNATEGLDTTARLMAYSNSIVKLHNKGAIIDGESVLVGSMNWGSSAALRNREMGVLIHHDGLAAEYLFSFEEDWNRLDSTTDSDGDLMPDQWEAQFGLNRHSAAVLGTALSEQSLDPDEDGLNNLEEFQLNGNPLSNDTDGDCILDGEESAFAQSVLRSPSFAMISGDVDENGVPDGEQHGCHIIVDVGGEDGGEGDGEGEGNGSEEEGEPSGGILNIREDPLSRPGAKFLFWLMVISTISLVLAGASMFLQPRKGTGEVLVDDSGYRFDDPDAHMAILKGTSFDEGAEDARARTEGRDDGSHGSIRLDGFGFESVTRDEVQWMLDQGHTIEEVRAELGEEE